MVSDSMQPVYYEILAAFAEQELDIVGQSVAVLLARSYCSLLEIVQYRDKVLNEADVPIFRENLETLEVVTKSYGELVKMYTAVSKQSKAKDAEPATEPLNIASAIQTELTKLRHDSRDSTD